MDHSRKSLIEFKRKYTNSSSDDPSFGWSSPSEETLTTERRASNFGANAETEESTSVSDNITVRELSDDCISDILGFECGEPLKPQHLKIDFNPLEGIDDNEYILNKCMAFWKMIEENPAIQHLKVLPEIVDGIHSFQHSTSLDINTRNEFALDEDTAPVLGCVEIIEKDAKKVNDVFCTKFKKKYCDEGSGAYSLDDMKVDSSKIPESPVENMKSSRKAGRLRVNKHWQNEGALAKQRSSIKRASQKQQTRQQEDLAKLYRDLEEWDSKHPKVMDPPAHPPSLCHAVMQRN